MTYLFFLGRTRDLSLAELETVLHRFQSDVSLNEMAPGIIEADCRVEAAVLMDILGGTMKIAEVLEKVDTMDTETLQKRVEAYFSSSGTPGKKLVFSLAEYHRRTDDPVRVEELKETLKKKLETNVRYIESPQGGLGAAQLLHHTIIELHLVQVGGKTTIARTAAIQDIDSWSKRDFGKPYRDPKKGMLPPKLARIMVNLGIGDHDPRQTLLFDPFCGSGTVLMEAMLLGCSVAGSDLDRQAVHGAGENVAWFAKTFSKPQSYTLTQQDATAVSLQDTKQRVDCIVTEPFLGKPNPQPVQVENIVRGLEKLYLGAMKRFREVVKPGGRVCIVFPAFVFGERVKTLESLVDRLETLGYTREKGPYTYTRPQTIVQRQILVFRLKE